MNRDQLRHIFNELGIKISVNDNLIKEESGYYENYNQIENDGLNWVYSEMNFEIRPLPEKEDIKKFDDEKEAIKYFFIKTLRKFYFNKIHTTNNPIRQIDTIEEAKVFFQNLGIEDDYYSFKVIRPHEVYAEIGDDKIKVSFIDEKKQKKFTTLPLDIKRGLFVMYRLSYSLHLLKMVEKEFLRRGILTEKFNDNDIELFIK
ncbi:hypothetical protein [Bacillus glycinifermentans]|uniref:hypothetical protein n=1 Tax=Bacillus glycinifermentans TaxID=1664069 RepID=UPI001FF4C921|nr:hypothetical protein [Bacillus glycinifermentans]UOY90474.1 hypothetical protein MW696_09915 [Bacillus glycinifermentans]